MTSLESTLGAELATLGSQDLLRVLNRIDRKCGAVATVNNKHLLSFGSNDYLGLSQHPQVVEAAISAALEWGAGATGSRLTSGSLAIHRSLEEELAEFEGAEDALVFSSGYAANLATIPALVGPGDLILSDSLNHASLIDGCRLSRAHIAVYPHADVERVSELLLDRNRFKRALLVTDGVFSMDGDLAPLSALIEICRMHDVWTMVDDAHGTGIVGATGRGSAERLGVRGQIDIHMGTLSKALGSAGGFVAGSETLVAWLRNRARSFVFSTAPVPAAIGAAHAALQVMQAEPELRQRCMELSAQVRQELHSLGFRVSSGETPIIPVVTGSAADALCLSAELLQRGIWIPAIRPPTVPEGQSRLRLTLSAVHTDEDVEALINAFRQIGTGGVV